MATSIKVKKADGDKHVKFNLVDGKLPLSTLQVYWPTATGLLQVDDTEETVLSVVDNKVLSPPEGWAGDSRYQPIFPQKPGVAMNPPTTVVMAPERRLPTFSGIEEASGKMPIDEFVTAVRHAFERYHVTEGQRNQFLLDTLKRGPAQR